MAAPESPLRHALGNFSVLMGGRAVAGVVSVVVVALVARILGPEEFGVLVLVHTSAMVIRGLLNCKPSDTVVRYGVALFDAADRGAFTRLLRLTLALDVITAGAAALSMVVLVALAGSWLGLPDALRAPAALYGLALLASGTGTAKGILRVAGHFTAISVAQTIAPLLRLFGIGLAYAGGAGLPAYVLVWVGASLAEYAYLNVRGWRALRALGYSGLRPGLGAAADFPGIWTFVRTVYWQSNLELAQRHGLILLAGAVLGPAGAGMFRIAREFADVLAKPVVVVRQAVFPDLARLRQQGDGNFRMLVVRLGLLSAAVAAVVVGLVAVFGAELLTMLVGAAYAYGAGLLTWLMLAAAIDLGGAALRPAAYVIGAAASALRLQLLGAAVNVGLFALLVPVMGLTGAGLAAVAASATVAVTMVWLLSTAAPAVDPQTPR